MKCIAKIFYYMKKYKINIIYFFGLRSILCGIIPAVLLKIKTVNALRGDLDNYRSWYNRLLEKILSHFIDFWIANSKYALLNATIRGEAKRQKSKIIYNGIKQIARKNKFSSTNLLNIIVVANIQVYKGHRYLIRALSLLNEDQLKSIKVKFVGKNLFGDVINKLIKEYNLNSVIACLGYRSNVHEYLMESDLFILPSETESFPTAILEAMSFGLPVIATNVGGVSELIKNDNSGILVPSKDSNKLADAISLFIDDRGEINRERLNKYGGNSYDLIKRSYQINRMVEDHENYFKYIVKSLC